MDARLSGTLQELIDKVAAEFGVTKEFGKHVEMHLSGYQLKPVTTIVREFTALPGDMRLLHFKGLSESVWLGVGD